MRTIEEKAGGLLCLINQSELRDRVEVTVKDIYADSHQGGRAIRVLRHGYTPPVTLVDGRTVLTGNLDEHWLFEYLLKLIGKA